MATLTFPRVVIPAGSSDLGPGPIGDADSGISLTLDRTVAGGLNALTSDTTFEMVIFQSDDAGVSWQEIAGVSGVHGGTVLDKHGQPQTTVTITCGFSPGPSRLLKVTVIIGGPSPCAVAGTLVTT